MQLECEGNGEEYRFLETIVRIAGTRLTVQHRNHNGQAVWEGKELPRKTRVHKDANRNETHATNMLYGELHRLLINCTDNQMVLQAGMEMALEILRVQYPKKWFYNAVQRFMMQTNNLVWDIVLDFYMKNAR